MTTEALHTFDSSVWETEQGANTALLELNKGLRSTPGEQSEAIVKFPRLFEKFPFPIVINSAFLKLAEVFRNGNNFHRQCILRVTQQSNKHLDKIINVDGFIRTVMSVLHSNDPIARAITLRVLGSVSVIIPEHKGVHHSVHSSLSSHDQIEVEAAVFATQRFSANSRFVDVVAMKSLDTEPSDGHLVAIAGHGDQSFALNTWPRIVEMILSMDINLEMKLQLIPVLQYVHHSPDACGQVRTLCQERLLVEYPNCKSTWVILNTLTQLSMLHRIDVKEQISLLLNYLTTDIRVKIKLLCLHNLVQLAQSMPHIFEEGDISDIFKLAPQLPRNSLLRLALRLLATLCQTVARTRFPALTRSLLREHLVSSCPEVAIQSLEVYVSLVLGRTSDSRNSMGCCGEDKMETDCDEDIDDMVKECTAGVISLLPLAIKQSSCSIGVTLKPLLSLVLKICSVELSLTSSFVFCLIDQLDSTTYTKRCCMLRCLFSLATQHQIPIQHQDTLIKLFDSSTEPEEYRLIGNILVIARSPDRVIRSKMADEEDGWLIFLVARQAARFGRHGLAAHLFQSLKRRVTTEHYHFFLEALSRLCRAEADFVDNADSSFLIGQPINADSSLLIGQLENSLENFHLALTAFKAAVTPGYPLNFQLTYTKLRCKYASLLYNLVMLIVSSRMCPPPAIADGDVDKFLSINNTLSIISKSFLELSDQLSSLYRTSFDADPSTLVHLRLIQSQVDIVAMCLGGQQSPLQPGSGRSPLVAVNRKLHDVAKKMAMTKINLWLGMLLSIVRIILLTPVSLPRFFFQNLQNTSIKLAVSAGNKPSSDSVPILISNEIKLSVKIEGVIQQTDKPFRVISEVNVITNVVCNNLAKVASVVEKVGLITNVVGNNLAKVASVVEKGITLESLTSHMEQMTKPHNDYFSSHVVLSFPYAGTYSVSIDTTVLDQSGIVWKIGPTSGLIVKSTSHEQQMQRPHKSMPVAKYPPPRNMMIPG